MAARNQQNYQVFYDPWTNSYGAIPAEAIIEDAATRA